MEERKQVGRTHKVTVNEGDRYMFLSFKKLVESPEVSLNLK